MLRAIRRERLAIPLSGRSEPNLATASISSRSRRKSYIEQNLNRQHVDKMRLAMASVPHMTRELMESRFDWNEQMAKIVERVESWNR